MERSEGLLGLQMWEPSRKCNTLSYLHELQPESVPPSTNVCYNLVAAMIHQAIDDLQPKFYRVPRPTLACPYPSKLNPDTRNAFWWLFVDEGQEVMSFAWCCGVLDLSPRELRLRIGALHPAVCWECAKEYAVRLEL